MNEKWRIYFDNCRIHLTYSVDMVWQPRDPKANRDDEQDLGGLLVSPHRDLGPGGRHLSGGNGSAAAAPATAHAGGGHVPLLPVGAAATAHAARLTAMPHCVDSERANKILINMNIRRSSVSLKNILICKKKTPI